MTAGLHVPRRIPGHRSVAATRPWIWAGEGAGVEVALAGGAGAIPVAIDAADAAAAGVSPLL